MKCGQSTHGIRGAIAERMIVMQALGGMFIFNEHRKPGEQQRVRLS